MGTAEKKIPFVDKNLNLIDCELAGKSRNKQLSNWKENAMREWRKTYKKRCHRG
jgi:hypothetical protein